MATQTQTAGESIRTLRQLAGMTLNEVAETAGTSIAYLSKVETGKFLPSKAYVALVTAAIAEGLRRAA